MNKRLFLIGMLSLQARAAEPESPPMIAPMPSSASWRITFSTSSGGANRAGNSAGATPGAGTGSGTESKGRTIESISYTKVGKQRREEIQWSNGEKTTGWIVEEWGVNEDGESREWITETGEWNDHPMLGWSSGAKYIRSVIFRGERSDVYDSHQPLFESSPGHWRQAPVSMVKALDLKSPGVPARLYLSSRTHLPLAVIIGGRLGLFTISAAEPQLKVPDEVLGHWRTWTKNSQNLRHRPRIP